MRLVVFSSFFLPHKGGVEGYVLETGKRLVRRGHEVTVVTARLKGTKKCENVKGVQVIRVPVLMLLSGQYPVPWKVPKLERPDVVVTHTRFYVLSFLGGRFARKEKVPWLHVEHGSRQVPYKSAVAKWGSCLVDATIGRWVLKNARVAGVSRASCRFAKEWGAKSCTVISNAVDVTFFSGKRAKRKKATIAFVGRLIEEKGVTDLLKAVEGLDVDVIMVGTGPLRKKFSGDRRFVGAMDKKGIRDVLAKADIFVNPSYAEGLPTSVLEAGAMGVAVVATDVGGTREIVEDGKNGCLVPPGDVELLRERIETLLKSKKLRREFGKALQKKVRERFSWESTVDKLERVLRQ